MDRKLDADAQIESTMETGKSERNGTRFQTPHARYQHLFQAQKDPCFDFQSHEITSVIAAMAGALPGLFVGAGTAKAGTAVGLSPLGERILHIATDAPGVALEIVQVITGG